MEVIVAFIGASSAVLVGLFTWSSHRANRTDARISVLWARVDKLEEDLCAERSYSAILHQHIMEGKPPPPPPRPTMPARKG